MNAANPVAQEPDGPCPQWCVMHVEGRHVGELELAEELQGYNIYVRPTDYGDGQVGMEVVVAMPDAMQTARVDILPAEVRAAAQRVVLGQVTPIDDPAVGDEGGEQQ